MKAEVLISRYNHLNGKQISVATLKAFHQDIQQFLDSVGHGPFVKELRGVLTRATSALKQAAGYEVIDRIELTPIDLTKPTIEPKPVKKVVKKTDAKQKRKKRIRKKAVKPKPAVKRRPKAKPDAGNTRSDLAGLDYGLEMIPHDQVKYYSEQEGLGFTKEGQQKIYDMITGMILKVIKENKVLPWRKPWKIETILATNFKTKTVYKGANLYLLNLIAPMFFGKIGPYWLTFKQVKDLGGRVKAGASAFPVIYYSVYYSVNKPQRKTITEEEYNAMTPEQRVEREAKELWTINYYNVFPQEDIEGIEFPSHAATRVASPIESAEAIVQGMPQRPDIQHHKVGRAFYAPDDDYIKVPEINYFASDQEYYSTLFHELVHSTGHSSRLDRFEANKKVAPDGRDYDFEELIAEMGASYLNAEAGILYFTLKNSAAYLKGWQKKLEDAMTDDNKFFLKASAKAAQAADFILNKQQESKAAKGSTDAAANVKERIDALDEYEAQGYRVDSLRALKAAMYDDLRRSALAFEIMDYAMGIWPKDLTENMKKHPLSSVGQFFYSDVNSLEEWKRTQKQWDKDKTKPLDRSAIKKPSRERSKKPAAAMAGFSKNPNGIVSADHLAGMTFKEIPLDGEWKTEFNRLMSDTQIMIWGVPGSGKTVKLLKFAQYLAEKGLRTLYVANEEFGRSSFTEKIREFKIGNSNLMFAKHLPEDLRQFDAIFLDSVQSLGMDLEAYKHFRERNPGKLSVAIIQSTKDGDFRGGKDWEHEVDIAAEVVSRKLMMHKNRLDPDHEAKAEKIQIEHLVNEKTKQAKIRNEVKQKAAA